MKQRPIDWKTLGWFALALVVWGIMAGVAPEPWPDGPADVVVEAGSSKERLAIDHTRPDAVRGEVWSVVSSGGESVELRVTHATRSLDLGDVRVSLRLADGRDVLVPVVHAEDGAVVARRTPPRGAAWVLGLLGAVVVLWLSEAVPLWVTSLAVPILLVLGGVGTARGALAPYFHPVIALFFAGFALADAMGRCGLDRRIALRLVSRAGGSPLMLYGAMLTTSAVASMWMSNTAAAALLIPIAVAVSRPLGPDAVGFRKALVLGIAYAATLGGVGSAIGTPANPLAMEFLAQTGRTVGFLGWFAYGLPMVVVFLPVVAAWVWWGVGASVDPAEFSKARDEAVEQASALEPASRAELVVAAIFGLVVLGWVSDPIHGLHPGLTGLGGVVVLATFGRFDTAALGRIDWAALLTFGGGLTLGLHLADSGASDWIATRLELLAGLPPQVGVLAMGGLALGLTAVASNTASAAILIPLAVPLAGVLGVDPVTLVLVVALASSMDFALVIGTPPTMIAYSTGEYTAAEIFRLGIALDLIGLFLLVTVVIAFWSAVGLI